MPRSTIAHIELPAEQPTLIVAPWDDPIVDAIGYEVRSEYVELFWLNVLGPTSTWLLRRLAHGLERHPLGYELDLWETAKALGLAYSPGTASPFVRAMNRCVLFGVAQPIAGGLAVRRRVPPVSARQLMRMPNVLRVAHESWLRPVDVTDGALRARLLAEAMRRAGDEPDRIERQLLALGVQPHLAASHSATSHSPVEVRSQPDQ